MGCPTKGTSSRKAKIIPHGPGAAVEANSSYFSASKRCFTLHTLCKVCSEGLCIEAQQERIVFLATRPKTDEKITDEKIKDEKSTDREISDRESWKDQEWVQYLTWRECQQILSSERDIGVHIRCFATLSF